MRRQQLILLTAMQRVTQRTSLEPVPLYLKICEGLVKTQKADLVYKKEVAAMNSESSAIPVYTPHNIQQLWNLCFKELKQSQSSQDALYNFHEIAYYTQGFIWKITTVPDLVCICGLQEILDEVDRVPVLDPSSQILSYDNTFLLGDFYVSPLIFRHTLFKEAPCIPSMFLIHERKFTETHQEMFKECTKHIPSLRRQTAHCDRQRKSNCEGHWKWATIAYNSPLLERHFQGHLTMLPQAWGSCSRHCSVYWWCTPAVPFTNHGRVW